MLNQSRAAYILILLLSLSSSAIALEFIGTAAQLRAKYEKERRTLEQLHQTVTRDYKQAIRILNSAEEPSLESLRAAKAIIDATPDERLGKQTLLCAKLSVPLSALNRINPFELHINSSLVEEIMSIKTVFKGLMDHNVALCIRRDITIAYKNHAATKIQAALRGQQIRKKELVAHLRAEAATIAAADGR